VIHFQNVSKTYDALSALKDITFSVERGEMAYVTGPSGAGKTTLLRLIFLAEEPDHGTITVDGQRIDQLGDSDIPRLRRKVGVVFQDFKLLERRTAYENVALTLRVRGLPESAIKPAVFETLRMVNLRHKADSYPPTLSGGEQQRVAIARALIGEPTVLLADEPTGNLDPETAWGIMRIFKEINARGTTVLHATHNRDLFRGSAGRVFRLEGGGLFPEAGL
jgi:cell division transport system ATP-binding protein